MRRCFKIALLVLSYEGKLKKSRNLFHKTSIILWQEIKSFFWCTETEWSVFFQKFCVTWLLSPISFIVYSSINLFI